MRRLLPLLLIPGPALAQAEDAAHRADRQEVRRLNNRSPNGYAPVRRPAGNDPDAAGDAYARAQADYRDRLAAWRRRVAACEAGQYEACR